MSIAIGIIVGVVVGVLIVGVILVSWFNNFKG